MLRHLSPPIKNTLVNAEIQKFPLKIHLFHCHTTPLVCMSNYNMHNDLAKCGNFRLKDTQNNVIHTSLKMRFNQEKNL